MTMDDVKNCKNCGNDAISFHNYLDDPNEDYCIYCPECGEHTPMGNMLSFDMAVDLWNKENA